MSTTSSRSPTCCSWAIRWPPGWAARAPRLAWAHHTQAGVSNLLGSDLWTSPVTLTTSRGMVGATAIAEYVMAAASHFARGLQEGTRQKRDGVFTTRGYELISLRGATMGILGLGGIGREVARLSRAAGMRVIATRRSVAAPAADTDGADLVLPADRILQVAAESDFLAVCSQLTAETRGLVGGRGVRGDEARGGAHQHRPGRGGRRGCPDRRRHRGTHPRGGTRRVRRRARRPPPRAELVDLPQILLTPHISARGDAGLAGPLRHLFAENLRRFLDDRPLLNVVDRDRGY